MVFTREQQWKEVKLGRVFQLPIAKLATVESVTIERSEYIGYLGDAATFSQRLGRLIPKVELPIFIADGATWIWNWVDKHYPNSVQILDYYHAIEYAHDFAKAAFPDVEKRKSWIEGVKSYLFTNRIEALIRHLEALQLKGKTRGFNPIRATYRLLQKQPTPNVLWLLQRKEIDDWQWGH